MKNCVTICYNAQGMIEEERNIGQPKVHSAEDGFEILEMLGITNLTDEEKEVFKKEWKDVYGLNRNRLIDTTWQLYAAVLPFECLENDSNALSLSHLRDSDFGERLKVTGLENKLA